MIFAKPSVSKIASNRAAAQRQARAMSELRLIDGSAHTVAEILARTGLTLNRFGLLYRKGVRTWAGLV